MRGLSVCRGAPLLSAHERGPLPGNEFMSGVDCVVPAPDNQVASLALSALVHALAHTGRVAIVRYVKRANSPPTLGVLTPCA
jgi:hypothetical protein